MKITVSSKGQIVLPAELRQQDRIEAGQEFDIERLDRGEYRLKRRSVPPNEGVLDWLLAVPGRAFSSPPNRNRPTRCEISKEGTRGRLRGNDEEGLREAGTETAPI